MADEETPITKRFFQRWRGWLQGLRFVLSMSTHTTVKFELVLIADIEFDDAYVKDDLRYALPGWTVQPTSVDRQWRLTPPAYR